MDTRSSEQRRRIMQSVRQKDTGPELIVRQALHRLGYRFRLHDKKLPGKPDIVFSSRRKVIFVHGCFWHGHDCKKGRPPKSRPEYWIPKIEANKVRDEQTVNALRGAGWEAMTIWQCEIADNEHHIAKATDFLGPSGAKESGVEPGVE